MEGTMHAFAALIRAVPDFPRPGVLFRDITPLLADADGFAECIAALAAPWRDAGVQAVYGNDRLEARSDALQPGQRVLLVDDVLATGGTLAAAQALVGRFGAELAGAA